MRPVGSAAGSGHRGSCAEPVAGGRGGDGGDKTARGTPAETRLPSPRTPRTRCGCPPLPVPAHPAKFPQRPARPAAGSGAPLPRRDGSWDGARGLHGGRAPGVPGAGGRSAGVAGGQRARDGRGRSVRSGQGGDRAFSELTGAFMGRARGQFVHGASLPGGGQLSLGMAFHGRRLFWGPGGIVPVQRRCPGWLRLIRPPRQSCPGC